MNVSMRDAFLDELYNIAQKDRQVILLTHDDRVGHIGKVAARLEHTAQRGKT